MLSGPSLFPNLFHVTSLLWYYQAMVDSDIDYMLALYLEGWGAELGFNCWVHVAVLMFTSCDQLMGIYIQISNDKVIRI